MTSATRRTAAPLTTYGSASHRASAEKPTRRAEGGTIAKRILFTGYAPTHFVCFRPVYRRLAAESGVEVWLSGGFRSKTGEATEYSLEGFYDPFDVDRDRVIPIEQARREDFDAVVCAHLSDTLFPRSAAKKVQIFHGVSFKNLAVREKALRFDELCLPGEYHARMYREQGLVRPGGARCLVTGFPKADALVAGPFDRAALLGGIGLDPALPTVLVANTGDRHNLLETWGEDMLRALVDAGRWNVLVKPHDHPKNPIDWFERLAPLEGPRLRLVRDLDATPWLRAADALVIDASSLAVEFALLDRPIVFLDVPKLLRKVTKRAPALDLDTYGRRIGVVVPEGADPAAAVAEALADPGRESALRRAAAADVFHLPGSAAARVAGVILHATGVVDELPEGVRVLDV